jgi:hypothetical protein
MSAPLSERRHQRAARGLADLGDTLAEHEVLSVQCAHSHHVAAVYDTPAGLVFRSITGPHAHGRKDRADVAHHGSHHGDLYVELLTDPEVGDAVPGWCDCGSWSISRLDLIADVRAGRRTTHVA